VVGAARVLEAALRRDPSRYDFAAALGGLLLRYGKVDAAVRALQRVPPDSAARADALELLVGALDRMGLREASAEASAELSQIKSDPKRSQIGSKNRPIATSAPRVVRTRLFGRYEVVRDVAQSPSARVVECIDAVRGDRVAVKIFAAYDARGSGRDAIARFEREVRVTAALDHPNVVPLLNFIPEGPAIVLGWMSGGTLETMIASHELSPARAVEIACAVLTALGEAHRLGVLHRDVKPANVLFDSAGVARLGDFGVAHLGDLSTTATAGVIGTLAYMSPEQREGHPATVQSDIYGIGAILYEMLSGERPDALEPPRTRPSGAHRDLSTQHDAIALRLIARDPSERPPDAFAARRALTSLTWPQIVEPAARRPASVRAPAHKSDEDDSKATRVENREGAVAFDRWTMREFIRVPLNGASIARASAFARAGHPNLQTVLRVHRDASEIWLDSPKGHALNSRLTPLQARALADAVDALHENGIVHGHIDAPHIFTDDNNRDAVTLLFEAAFDPSATIDLDRIAIARLASREP
jgi:serine/threonine protein kinase